MDFPGEMCDNEKVKTRVKHMEERVLHMYQIKTIASMDELDQGNTALVDIYNWGGDYRPVTRAVLCFIKDQGFALRLTCEEENPRATFTEQNTGVCRDSCLEFFANFRPDLPDTGYINFEGNANGALLCCYGSCVEERETIADMGLEHPLPKVVRGEGFWGYELMIPLSLIEGVYGPSPFKTGSVIRGNFFKCGDETEFPHFGSYTKIDWEYPSFHRPQFFAEMQITD